MFTVAGNRAVDTIVRNCETFACAEKELKGLSQMPGFEEASDSAVRDWVWREYDPQPDPGAGPRVHNESKGPLEFILDAIVPAPTNGLAAARAAVREGVAARKAAWAAKRDTPAKYLSRKRRKPCKKMKKKDCPKRCQKYKRTNKGTGCRKAGKRYKKYKGRKYVVRTGSRGGKYIKALGKKVYV
jgi:hypothetical protein